MTTTVGGAPTNCPAGQLAQDYVRAVLGLGDERFGLDVRDQDRIVDG
jgi:hypothetical protein